MSILTWNPKKDEQYTTVVAYDLMRSINVLRKRRGQKKIKTADFYQRALSAAEELKAKGMLKPTMSLAKCVNVLAENMKYGYNLDGESINIPLGTIYHYIPRSHGKEPDNKPAQGISVSKI